MKSASTSLTASVFSIAKGRSPSANDILPADALVIVIEERVSGRTAPPAIQWNHPGDTLCLGYEALPTLQRKAGKAYSDFPVPLLIPAVIDLAA
jgi:hypothetical protein